MLFQDYVDTSEPVLVRETITGGVDSHQRPPPVATTIKITGAFCVLYCGRFEWRLALGKQV